MEITALSWNIFHGRDFPPDRGLITTRSRLFGSSTRNATHVQVNRDLEPEFAHLLCMAAWDVALLQESPPRWAAELADATGAEQHRVLTSRNSLPALRTFVARHRPDLIASNEGGSNLTLVRPAAGAIAERRELVLAWSPERRVMAFTRLATGLCIANLHASTADELAADELRAGAKKAAKWAGDSPLIFGGDLNVRPRQSEVYNELAAEHGLHGATGDDAIDHLLVRGLEIAERARQWPPEQRELVEGGHRLRLSDHAPVEAAFSMHAATGSGPRAPAP